MSDLISREDAINKFVGLDMQVYKGNTCIGVRTCLTKEEIIYTIDDIPSAEPERKKGKWIPVESQTVNGRCSVCGYESHLYENDVYGEHYCPNCGAEMRGE